MAFWTLYKRELSSYFQSAVGYVVLFGNALIQSVSFLILVAFLKDSPYKAQSVMQICFSWPIFWFLLLGTIPLVTMRVFSEEFKLGTIEMLLTAPVTEWEVVLAKFFGALSFFLILWLPTVLDLVVLQMFSNPRPPLYPSQIWLTAMTLTLMGGLYISLGIFSSVLTKNQIIAAVLCYAFILVFFFASMLRWMQHMDTASLQWISYVSGPEHLANAGISLFDTRPIVFYVSLTTFMLIVTKTILEGRRLRG